MKKKLEVIKLENHSFQIDSEYDLIQTFRDKEQRRVVLPTTASYPLKVPFYYAWKESSGVYSYMVFRPSHWDTPRGLLFKRNRAHGEGARMCDWCLSLGSSEQVGMLTLTLNRRESISMMLCSDLACIDRLQEAAILSGKNFDKLAQQMLERVSRLFERVFSTKEVEDETTSSSI